MDGLAGVSQRVAEIQIRIGSLTATRPVAAQRLSSAGPASPAFSDVLAQAVSATSTAGTAPTARASAASAGRLDADGVPVDLAAYGNGKVPAAALAPIGRGSHRLWAPAAEAFGRMTDAAARDGVQIGVTDSYRSYEQQVDLARRKGLYSQGGLAATPGTSDHGWGLSLDLDLDARAQAWMRANAGSYGFAENVPREPWHWTFTP